MMKRGQVTAFIILGLIILVIIAMAINFKTEATERLMQQKTEENILLSQEANKIQEYVKSCIEQKMIEGVKLVSEYGGYFNLTGKQTVTRRPYFFYENKADMPTLALFEQKLEQYFKQEFPFCIKNFEEAGTQVVADLKEVKITINDEGFSANINYPITIVRETSEFKISPEYKKTIKAPLKKMLEAGKDVVAEAKNSVNDTYCATCFYDIAAKHNLQINMAYYDDESSVFHIMDVKTTIGDAPYELAFAA